jgi:cyanophycinase
MSLVSRTHSSIVAALIVPAALVAQTAKRAAPAAPKVGPPRGTVIVVGGGGMGPEVYSEFIKAAGGPNALIIDVPTAGGDTVYKQDAPGTRGWKNAGAKNLYVLHTNDRKLADSDSFVAVIKKAGGIWFEGGRQFHLVDSYANTKTEAAFNEVLARGGVIAGSSAGASILGDFLVRGAPSNNNFIMDYPGYEKGFAYLRGVGIDQHVVARERLADIADSLVAKYPNTLFISEDEGTAWVVRGDTATIIGRDKAFVYNGKDKTDEGKPFLTLYPGDKYNLATRHVMHRAADESPVKAAYVDSLFKKYSDASAGGATVLVAQGGKVFIDRSYGIPAQAKYMPTTTVPQFDVGDMGALFPSICEQLPAPARGRAGGNAAANAANANPDSVPPAGCRGRGGPPLTALQTCVANRVSGPIGMHKTNATAEGHVMSNVDELYRLSLGLNAPETFARDSTGAASRSFDPVKGWTVDSYRGVPRAAAYGAAGGKRNAFLRFPDKQATVIVLTNDDSADAKGMAEKIADKLLGAKKR